MDDTTTQLLTLLNVSALRRKRPIIDPVESPRLTKKKKTVFLVDPVTSPTTALQHNEEQVTHNDENDEEVRSNSSDDESHPEGVS